jgi:hypothetical protein
LIGNRRGQKRCEKCLEIEGVKIIEGLRLICGKLF